jgi:hypothetical protein
MTISENSIFFYPGKSGHTHDGENSSFIDTSKYSIFEFSWSTQIGDPLRQANQQRNYDSFRDFIVDTVNSSVLSPAGLVLQPGIVNGTAHIISRSLTTELIAANAITANEILAGTITSNLLAANFILVNNVISSNNYTQGVDGWTIRSNGYAEFNDVYIRGNIAINNTNYWLSSGLLEIGDGTTGIVWDGVILDITGTINAISGNIAGWEISGSNLQSGGAYPGSMIIGPGYGTGGTGAVYIESPTVTAGISAIARYEGYGTDYLLSNTVSNTVIQSLSITSGGIVYQHGNESFEFYWDAANTQLYAVIDGNFYCIAECGASPPSPVGVSPVGDPVGVSPVGVSPVGDPVGVSPTPTYDYYECTYEQQIYGICGPGCSILGGGAFCYNAP